LAKIPGGDQAIIPSRQSKSTKEKMTALHD
jgi:hypothetical protein